MLTLTFPGWLPIVSYEQAFQWVGIGKLLNQEKTGEKKLKAAENKDRVINKTRKNCIQIWVKFAKKVMHNSDYECVHHLFEQGAILSPYVKLY